MGFEKEKIKQIRGLIIFVAVIMLLVIYSGSVFEGLRMLIGMLVPFITGGAIAFVLNLPLRTIENKLMKKWNGKVTSKLKRPLSILLSIVFIVLILALVIYTVIPAIQETVGLLTTQIPVFAKQVIDRLQQLAVDYPEILEKLQEVENMEIDWEAMISNVSGFLTSGMGNVLTSAFSVASSIIGGVVNTFIAFVFSIYILSQKEKLANQGKRILKAYLSEKHCAGVHHVLQLLHKNFSNFITGQCVEAVILGCMFIIVLTIFQFKYALLIGVLIAFLSLIPIVGAFVGCFISAFLLLMDDPMRALWFIVIFLILQQIEGNLIYPYVVGGSVGLPSIWVLAAVSVGGSLCGVLGMLCFIPLVSTFYSLLRENVNRRNQKKQSGDDCRKTDVIQGADTVVVIEAENVMVTEIPEGENNKAVSGQTNTAPKQKNGGNQRKRSVNRKR
ncbi:MAG: AI-2E family transporter [Lachnospiraceae bacterium]|nr:AI-2E family transporter [Lachnospiraceae bacterium]